MEDIKPTEEQIEVQDEIQEETTTLEEKIEAVEEKPQVNVETFPTDPAEDEENVCVSCQ